MPVATLRTGGRKRPAQSDTLMRKASAAASGLLSHSERVLVVYEEGAATLYYETSDEPEDGIRRRKLRRAS